MNVFKLELTEFEIALGVTIADVQRELPRGAFIDDGRAFVVDGNVGPAPAMTVARTAFSGPVRFAGLNTFGMSVYRPTR